METHNNPYTQIFDSAKIQPAYASPQYIETLALHLGLMHNALGLALKQLLTAVNLQAQAAYSHLVTDHNHKKLDRIDKINKIDRISAMVEQYQQEPIEVLDITSSVEDNQRESEEQQEERSPVTSNPFGGVSQGLIPLSSEGSSPKKEAAKC